MIGRVEEEGAWAKVRTLGDRTWWSESDSADPYRMRNHNLLTESHERANLPQHDDTTPAPQLDSIIDFRSFHFIYTPHIPYHTFPNSSQVVFKT
jgi:hypothetical protein